MFKHLNFSKCARVAIAAGTALLIGTWAAPASASSDAAPAAMATKKIGPYIGNVTRVKPGPNKLFTNQDYVEKFYRKQSFDVENVEEVFDYVFTSLPDDVTVYPTENYYYFKFIYNGAQYAGNIRLDAADRDKGVLHFAYFTEYNVFETEQDTKHQAYTAEEGVKLTKAGPLTYVVTYKGKSVVFHLNDLTDTKPPAELVGAGEEYIGPVFDESGIQFFLMWNKKLKMFLYVLDKENAPERYQTSSYSHQIEIGLRTGFAYYKDRYLDRWILVGVRRQNSEVNNFFDGPFDQLPDNFIKGNALQDALLTLSPELRGQMDRWGNSLDLEGRMLVDPYVYYSEESELEAYDQCAARAPTKQEFYPCFSIGQT